MTPRMRQWARLVGMTWRAGPLRCCLIMVLYAVDIIGQPLVAIALRNVTDAAIAGDSEVVVEWAAVAAVAWAVSHQSYGVRAMLRNDIRERLDLKLSEEVMRLVAGAPGIAHLEDPETLDRIKALQRGGAVADTVWTVADILSAILALVATMLVLSASSPLLVLTFPLAIPTLWLNRVGQRKIRQAMAQAAEAERTAERLLELTFDPSVAVELHVTGAHAPLLTEYEARWADASRTVSAARIRTAGLLTLGWMIFLVGFVGGLGYVSWRVGRGEATVGDLVLLLAVTYQQQTLVQEIVSGFGRLLQGVHVAHAYFWLRDWAAADTARWPADFRHGPIPDRLSRGIFLENVSFMYPGTDRPVLRDITLHLPAGAMIAVVGEHGVGKSSLVKLLTQLYTPTTGAIRVDDIPLEQLPPVAWRTRVTCGFQDFIRPQTRAREAIGIGDLPHAEDPERLAYAVDEGGAQGVVQKLDAGLETRIGSEFGGVELSGGQWQKLALARTAMRQEPLLVVLDEPTASLDPISEYEVFQRQMAHAREMGRRNGAITVVVSHRFATVRMADKIIVLSDGAVAEVGDHDSLISIAGGLYARSYELQKKAYAG
jgi:ATP-binding cassette subfamily B protein